MLVIQNHTMLRYIFAFILLIHGLIHLLGFTKAFKLARVDQLSLPISKFAGLWWLLACILILVTLVAFSLQKEAWWMIGLAAILVSQTLIFAAWQDANFGTIANVLILIVCIIAYGSWSFNRLVEVEKASFQTLEIKEPQIISAGMITHLPQAVQIWMERSHVIGKKQIQRVRLKQTGEMRTTPDGKWMQVTAEQFFTVNEPGFLWVANVTAAPFLHLAGRDKYQHGKGHMLIKLLSLIPVADAKGSETDQGTLLRFLSEIIWFPTAVVSDYISWEEIDTHSAKATMHYGEISASGIFRFNDSGDVIGFEAERYYDRKEGATLENWLIDIDEERFESFDGIRIPVKASVTWKLDAGDFTWYKLEISEVVY